MLSQVPLLNEDALNRHVGQEGEVRGGESLEELRVYDGQTPGGWRVSLGRAFVPNIPGIDTVLFGDQNAGYYGEVATTDFIDGDQLAELAGYTSGTSDDPTAGWLKFAYEGRILFVAKRTFRNYLTKTSLISGDLVNGNRIIEIDDNRYKIRLLRGYGPVSSPWSSGDSNPAVGVGSEWNDLMYRVCVVTPNRQVGENWAEFTEEELGLLRSGLSKGVASWMMESFPDDTTQSILRGYLGLSRIHRYPNTHGPSSDFGWRPVLELVQ